MFAGSLTLPLFVTRELHQPETAIGPLYSACAAVEIVATLALAAVPTRVDQRLLIAGGMALFIVYFIAVVLAQGLGLLMVAQIARGTAIAVVGAAGIRYFQDAWLRPPAGRPRCSPMRPPVACWWPAFCPAPVWKPSATERLYCCAAPSPRSAQPRSGSLRPPVRPVPGAGRCRQFSPEPGRPSMIPSRIAAITT